MATQKRTTGFRPWVWIAVAPTILAVDAVIEGIPLLAPIWLLFAAGFGYLAWRGRKTPWWAAVGWIVCVVGAINVIGSTSPAVGLMFVGIGGALGVAGLVINAMKRETIPLPDESAA